MNTPAKPSHIKTIVFIREGFAGRSRNYIRPLKRLLINLGMVERQQKIDAELTKVIAEFLRREFGAAPLVTVTHTKIARGLKSAIVFLSIFPETEERAVHARLKKRRKELNEYIAARMKMKYLPLVSFEIDRGEKNRQRIDELLR